MVFLNRAWKTCLTNIYDPTPIDLLITTKAAAIRNIHVVSGIFEIRNVFLYLLMPNNGIQSKNVVLIFFIEFLSF